MSRFDQFSDAVHLRYESMKSDELYVVDIEDIYASYLAAFPEGSNPIFRERTEHDCQTCKQFIRRIGRVVSIKNGSIFTVWDECEELPYPYNTVGAAMAALVRQAPIKGIFRSKEMRYGLAYNFDNKMDQKWEHFHGDVAKKHHSNEPDAAIGSARISFQLFKRGLTELNFDSIKDVLELIDNNGLYRGEEHKSALISFQCYITDYELSGKSDLYVWENLHQRHAAFRNTVIGSLIVDLSDGMDIDNAVRMFESKVAPQNYKRSSSVITPRMIEDAVGKLEALGLEGAVHRRFARIEDVSVNDVLFVDNSVQERMRDGLRGTLMEAAEVPSVDIKNAATITVDEFVRIVVPKAESIHVLVENRHQGNFVSLTGGDGPERLFKWGNNFAWSYDGEVTDSIKEKVKRAGGRVEGTSLRVSLSWFNYDDLDLHSETPYGHVYYIHKAGILDVDMNAGSGDTREPVENQSFFGRLQDGPYRFYVNQYSLRENKDFGFTVEVEFDGKVEQLSYPRKVMGIVQALTLDVKNGKVINFKPCANMTIGSAGIEKWGVKTETLVRVNSLMLSPNHWSGQEVGSKHWFFMLKDCHNDQPVRGIYNEFLRGDLNEHRKVFEVLSGKTKCQPTPDQLSGIGFTKGRDQSLKIVTRDKGRNRAFNVLF